MTEDLPSDVHAVLAQLLAEARKALTDGDHETAREATDSAREVATNKLPEGELRGELLHGCEEVLDLLDPTESVESEVAEGYLAAMERRLPEE